MNRHVLITGSSGFVGSNLIDFLQQKNFSVIGLDCCPSKFVEPNYFIKTDIRDKNTLREILKEYKPCAVFHLAAISTIQRGQTNPQDTWSVNFGGTRALLDAVNFAGLNNTKIFFASTDKVYGVLPTGADSYTEEMPLCPINTSPYDCSKAAADQLVQTANNTYVLRFCNLYGPYDTNKSRIVPATIITLLDNRANRIYGGASQRAILNRYKDKDGVVRDFYRDMLYIDDLCKALANLVNKTLETNLPEKIFNFGVGTPNSMKDVITKINIFMGNVTCPPKVNIVPTTNELIRQSVNSSRAQNFLNFCPTTSLDDGLRQTIEWWKNIIKTDKWW